MSSVVFPLAALLVSALLLTPALTMVAAILLTELRRRQTEVTGYGSGAVYFIVTAPVLVPGIWLASASIHQSLPGGALDACAEHGLPLALCGCAMLLAALLVAGTAATAVRLLRREGGRRASMACGHPDAVARVHRLLGAREGLQTIVGRVSLVERESPAACTRGWWKPKIELSPAFVDAIDDDMLEAVLLHEAEHLGCSDALRTFVGELCLRMNVLGHVLRPDFARWRLAREIACDQHAVESGANGLALAQAILVAARLPRVSVASVGLSSASNAEAIEVRVRLLLDPPSNLCACGSRRSAAAGVLALAVLAAIPHVFTAEPLDRFHREIDALVHSL